MRRHAYLSYVVGMAVAATVLAACGSSGGSSGSSAQATGNAANNGSRSSSAPGGTTPVTLQLLWLPQTQFAGYYTALAKGFYKDAGLDVKIDPGGPNITPAALVASGAADFGAGIGPLDVVTSAAKGVKLVEVAQTDQEDFTRLVSKKSLGITSPKGLEGKTVGYFVGTWLYTAKAMVAKAGGDPSKVKWTIQGTNLSPIESGSWAAGSADTMNEMLTLAKDKVALNVFDPNKYGVGFSREGIATSASYLAKHSATVKAFLAASLRGWQYSFAHPDEAVKIIQKYGQNLEASHQLAQLKAMQGLLCTGPALTDGMGAVNTAEFQRAADFLYENKVITSKVADVASTYNTDILALVPKSDRTCP